MDISTNVIESQVPDGGVSEYGYDAIGRLISSNNENNISYDANGNVRSLRRISATGEEIIADLTMSYNDNNRGNRLASVTNTGTEDTGTFTYAYDSSGNLTSDTRNSLEIQNNVLNLPMRVNQSGTMGGTMTYTYLGDGTRVAARVGTSPTSHAGKRYRGTFVYDVTSGGAQSLESVAVSTGRLIALTGTNGAVSFESDGFITDHLGNVAVVVNLSASSATSTDNAILEQNEYTPFGTKLNVTGLKSQTANRWRYAGKEEQDIAGMNLRLLDFGVRYYDSFTCRWNAVDPLAHKYFPMSPYNYCGNDPVNRFDPDGKAEILVRVAVGSVIGAGVEGITAAVQGKSSNEIKGAIAKGAIEGAVIGATFNVKMGVAAAVAVNAVTGAAGSAAEQVISEGTDNINWKKRRSWCNCWIWDKFSR